MSIKGMKQTKPAQAMELRSLSPVLGGPEVDGMMPAEPSVVTPESAFEAAIIEAAREILSESNRNYLLVPRFGLDFAVFLD